MITKYSFDSKHPGKSILILGSIHGDEHCGSWAIEALRNALVKAEIVLQSGSITCMPYANFEAYHADKRQIETNLNRVFARTGNSKEEKIVKYIQREIETHDFVLDLHSFSSGKEPFAFHDMPGNSLVDTVIKNLPIDYVMTGWTEMYADSPELDTIGYAKKINKDGIVIECGENKNPFSYPNAYNYILSTLSTLWTVDVVNFPSNRQKWIDVDAIVRKKTGGKFIKDWENFDPVKKDQIVAYDGEENPILAPYDGYMIMPNQEVEVGGEWMYFGKTL